MPSPALSSGFSVPGSTAPPAAPARESPIRAWVLLVLIWLAVLALAGYQWHRTRDQLITDDLNRLQSQSQAIEYNLVRQLTGVSNALDGVRELLALNPSDAALRARLGVLASVMPDVYAFQVLDARGAVIAASSRESQGIGPQTRAYFAVARDNPNPLVLHLSPPFPAVHGHYTVVLSRAMLDARGEFSGVVSAWLDPEYFESVLLSSVYAQDARATMAHGDGTIIVSAPAQDARPGLNLNQPGSMFRRHVDSRQTSTLQQGLLVGVGEHRQMALRTIVSDRLPMDYPLVVRVSRRTDDVLQPWRAETWREALLLLSGALASGSWLWWHQRQRRVDDRAQRAAMQAERDSARRLELCLHSAELGLWEWDLAGDSMRLDAREMEILGLAPTAGPMATTSWRQLLHPEELTMINTALREHLRGRTPAYRIEHRCRHQKGHWIWVRNHAMVMERNAEGRATRVVGTHLDITALKQSQHDLQTLNAQLEALSLTDGLTGIANRRRFDQALALEWTRALRQRQPLALLMIDVDHFKAYNDHLGHPEGDRCLCAVVRILSACLRQPIETLMRYGGEEFSVLLINADLEAATRVAQRCLEAITSAQLKHPASPAGTYLSVSIGIASQQMPCNGQPAHLVAAADTALYLAKQQGRGRYATASGTAPPLQSA